MAAHYPGLAPIDSYGNGGFRFAGMSHRGSVLCLPTGVFGWDPESAEALRPAHFAAVFAAKSSIDFVLLGTGAALAMPNAEVRSAFADQGVGLEPMDTGAASRTYNILLAEGRRVSAALIAVA